MGKKQIAAEGILIVALILVSCSLFGKFFMVIFENRASLQENFCGKFSGDYFMLCNTESKNKRKE